MVDRWLSIVGATTGLTALGFQLWQFVLSGPRIKVKLSHGFLANASVENRKPEHLMVITVANHGRLAASIQYLFVELSWEGKTIPLVEFNGSINTGPNLPYRIDSNSQENWIIPLMSLATLQTVDLEVDTVRALMTLSNGKQIRSRGFLVNPDGTGGPLDRQTYLRYMKISKWVSKRIKGRKAGRGARKRWGVRS